MYRTDSFVKKSLLFMMKRFLRDWDQLENIKELPFLTDLVFLGNPVEEESAEDGSYVTKVSPGL